MTTRSGETNSSMIGFRCSLELREELKDWCWENHLTVADVLLELLEMLMDRGDWLGEELRERLVGGGVKFEEVQGG